MNLILQNFFQWHAAFKKTKVKLDILTDIDMLLMEEKGMRGQIFISMQKLITNNKIMIKTKNLYIFNIGM